jgi:spore germination cell wall hydrolase CwlJ-like protein
MTEQQRRSRRMGTPVLAGLLAGLWVGMGAAVAANSRDEQLAWVVLAEAANQGEEGLYAVACVVRNRGYQINGFSAARRTDLRAFALRQPAQVQRWAADAIARVRRGGADVTGGATHYENVRAFGTPRWARGRTPTARIGDHVFWAIAD